MIRCSWCYLFVFVFYLANTVAYSAEFSGNIALEARAFFDTELDPRQSDNNLSLVLEPQWYQSLKNGRDAISFKPYLRWDQHDDERSHFDIRELEWTTARDDWELRAGIRKVYWGVTESVHLVDIINQTDAVDNVDGEDKLGQPMVNLALVRDWGTIDLFVLPGFRERSFAGAEGRLRSVPRVDNSRAVYESSREDRHIDWAARWSHAIGDWDIGVAHFSGTSRDPRFMPGLLAGEPILIPIYDQIDQTSVDLQATKESWLWKLEAMRRSAQSEAYLAAVAGVEYSFYGVFESSTDLGLVMEYLYDNRGVTASTPFEDDLFVGLRLALNDEQSSEALIGCIADIDDSSRFCSVETSRRLASNWVFTLEARVFNNIDVGDLLFSLRQDDFIQAEFAYHF